MLTEQQILVLTNLHGNGTIEHDGKIISIVPNKKDRQIVCDYETFKLQMGLDDIRFHWMLSSNIYLAGGSVLAWMWPETKNEDYDFYFKTKHAANAFENLITSYGCKKIKHSSLTDTYQYEDAIIQLVGINERETKDYYGASIAMKWFKDILTIMDRFDFHASKFAVDSDNFYTTSKAIESLLSRSLTLNATRTNARRLEKYIEKGFFPVEGIDYERFNENSWY